MSKYKLSNSGIWVPSMSWEINGHLSEINLKNLGIPELLKMLKNVYSNRAPAPSDSELVELPQYRWNSSFYLPILLRYSLSKLVKLTLSGASTTAAACI